MNAFARIRAALEMSKHASSYCVLPGLERKTDDALPALAEIEQSIAARDSEIARLETDLELARRDAERYRWIRDSDNEGPISAGNATAFGEYGFERVEWFYDDELDAAVDEARAGNWG